MSHTNRSVRPHIAAFAGVLALMLLAAVPLAAAESDVTLPANTIIPVFLEGSLSSNESQAGDTFTAAVNTSGKDAYAGIPDGAKVEGTVKEAQAKEGKDPGLLDLQFDRLLLPNGDTFKINGSLASLDSKDVSTASDGRLVAKKSSKNNRMTYLGYGAGVGLLVGILGGHDTGDLLKDALIGAGLGYLAGSVNTSSTHDVALKEGTELGVVLADKVVVASHTRENNPAPRPSPAQTAQVVRAEYGQPAAPSAIGVMVGDESVQFSSFAQPLIVKGVLLVPAAPVMTTAGVPYRYDAATRSVIAEGPTGEVRIAIGSRIAVVNGVQRVRLEAPAQIFKSTTYVPMRFLGVVTGKTVGWDGASKTATLSDESEGSALIQDPA